MSNLQHTSATTPHRSRYYARRSSLVVLQAWLSRLGREGRDLGAYLTDASGLNRRLSIGVVTSIPQRRLVGQGGIPSLAAAPQRRQTVAVGQETERGAFPTMLRQRGTAHPFQDVAAPISSPEVEL
jgi:hypothetical protein